jgi:hypothetical protein
VSAFSDCVAISFAVAAADGFETASGMATAIISNAAWMNPRLVMMLSLVKPQPWRRARILPFCFNVQQRNAFPH